MNVKATDKSVVNTQINLVNPNIFTTNITNHTTILHDVAQTFTEEINCVRSKWKDIQKTDELTTDITCKVDQVTNKVDEMAHQLESVRKALQYKSNCTEELRKDIVCFREDANDICTNSKWKACEQEYSEDHEQVEKQRIEDLKMERLQLERETHIIKHLFANAISDLCEADEKLRHLKSLTEELEDDNKKEIRKWKESLNISADVSKKTYPAQTEMKLLRKSVQELRRKVGVLEKRSRSERAEYKYIQQQCLDAVDKIRGIRYLIAENQGRVDAMVVCDSSEEVKDAIIDLEQISATILKTELCA